jgi:uncharacterized protein
MSQRPREEEEEHPPVEIPAESLAAETLKAIVESFVLREGTDYGRQEIETETKTAQIMKQITKGHVRILFDPNTESVTLVTENEFKKLKASGKIVSRQPDLQAD